jgi:hypothetical protein
MLNIRVFTLVALATFGVAAVLHALGSAWSVRGDAVQAFAQAVVSRVAEKMPAQTLPALAVMERASVSGAASAEPGSGGADRAEERLQRGESRAERSGAEHSRDRRGRGRRPRSRAVLVRAAAPAMGGLQAEQRQLEIVQKALARGRGAAAARALDEYGAVLPSGELALEAELLRIDVALARGERDRALQLARAFDSRPGAERYRERLAARLGSAVCEDLQTACMGSR